jgi:hypothetical protein
VADLVIELLLDGLLDQLQRGVLGRHAASIEAINPPALRA